MPKICDLRGDISMVPVITAARVLHAIQMEAKVAKKFATAYYTYISKHLHLFFQYFLLYQR